MKRALGVLAAVGLCAGVASGQTFLATNNLADTNGYTGGGDQLITFQWGNAAGWAPVNNGFNGEIRDAATGAGIDGVAGLDFDHSTGRLYAATGFGDRPGNFWAIDPMTAEATLIGQMGVDIADLAWNPVDGRMYGTSSSTLYTIDLNTGQATQVGTYDVSNMLEVGLGVDSEGRMHVHDLTSNTIYRSTTPGGTSLQTLHSIPFNTNFSQGLFVDWTTNQGYHAALDASNLDSVNYEYTLTAGSYTFVDLFPEEPSTGLPQVEVGDLTFFIPAPGTAALLAMGGLLAMRRRRA